MACRHNVGLRILDSSDLYLINQPVLVSFELSPSRAQLLLQVFTAHVEHVQHHGELDVLQNLRVDSLLLFEVEPELLVKHKNIEDITSKTLLTFCKRLALLPDHLNSHIAGQSTDSHSLGVLCILVQRGTMLGDGLR